MIQFMFGWFWQDACVTENFSTQINPVFECTACNQRPYLQITTVDSSTFGSLTKIN